MGHEILPEVIQTYFCLLRKFEAGPTGNLPLNL